MQIAVDGPSGSGKSTICKIIAERYSLIYLDTGAMYRSVAWLWLHIASLSEDELILLLEDTEFLFSDNGKSLKVIYIKDGRHEVDLTEAIRTPEVTKHVSTVASSENVRKILTEKQRQIAENADVILDGRDIGTVVLPNARLKFFLTASAEERAKRRTKEWQQKGIDAKYEEVLSDILMRDKMDTERETAPLRRADDAIIIDTTHLTIDNITGIIGTAIEEFRISGVK